VLVNLFKICVRQGAGGKATILPIIEEVRSGPEESPAEPEFVPPPRSGGYTTSEIAPVEAIDCGVVTDPGSVDNGAAGNVYEFTEEGQQPKPKIFLQSLELTDEG
jgi:hypothetical protein